MFPAWGPRPVILGVIQQFKLLNLQPPGPTITVSLRSGHQNKRSSNNSNPISFPSAKKHARRHLALVGLQRSPWIQVCVLSPDTGFESGPTLLAGFPLHGDPNTTTAIPSSTTYKQQRIQIRGWVEKVSAWTGMTPWVIFKIHAAHE